ncbi:MAG TPA: RluA family pseudouridine synthase [Thermoanaerobaculia bacterium]|nr:RluA family pseudouridine synthase [Thermoanaerobaculia bacterium]
MREIQKDEASLLEALERMFPDSSRSTLRKMLRATRVRVNGELEPDAKRVLHAGDVLDVSNRSSQQHLDPRLSILFEDEEILVVVKSAGLLTVASPGEGEETAQAFLNAYLKAGETGRRIQVVHRLDRDTSGVLVFAKSFKSKEALKQRFAEHDIHRMYVAIIDGSMPRTEGMIQSFLAEDRNLRVRSVSSPSRGKLATTHYRTIKAGTRFSMLEVRLETGKRNQIRVHFAEAGHPVVGDTMYGNGVDPIGRLGLHAMELGLVHPVTGRQMKFTAPLPDSFSRLEL